MKNEIKWLQKYTEAEIRAIRKAVDKVEATNKNYRESQNEWRGQLKDQVEHFATTDVLNAVRAAMEASREIQNSRIDKLEQSKSNMEGRIWMIGALWAVLVVIISWYLNR